jgi:hypothetical protein
MNKVQHASNKQVKEEKGCQRTVIFVVDYFMFDGAEEFLFLAFRLVS